MKILIGSLLLFMSSLAFGANDSVYTSIDSKDCVTIVDSKLDPKAEIDYYTIYCQGFNEYAVVISGGDLRYNLSLLHQGNEVKFQNPPGFYEPASKFIEWRGPVNADGTVTQFHSLIYRLNIEYLGPNGQNIIEDHLYVVRLQGTSSCIIGDVQQSPTMNQDARDIADNMALACP